MSRWSGSHARVLDTTQFVKSRHQKHCDELSQKPGFAEFKLTQQEPFAILRHFAKSVPLALCNLAKTDCKQFLDLARDSLKRQTGDWIPTHGLTATGGEGARATRSRIAIRSINRRFGRYGKRSHLNAFRRYGG
jgi:hypothetical protein